jgi:hypothetical protein
MSARDETAKTIVVRDRRKPNQYTTDNVIAREWLPILRVGDALFFYSVYLSMANRETESSWSSLRTLSNYLQCGIDLIVRGNKLLEICELVHIETGNHRTSNEYYILDPPSLTPDLADRILHRLEDISRQETSKNWQAWARQVKKALQRHRSLPDIWAERRGKRGGRPIKTVRPENPVRETQAGFFEKGARESHTGLAWPTISPHVSHDPSARETQAEQDKQTSYTEQERMKEGDPSLLLFRSRCAALDLSPQIQDLLLREYALPHLLQQLEWLPFRSARDPAAMLVSAVRGGWSAPANYEEMEAREIWQQWMQDEPEPLGEQMSRAAQDGAAHDAGAHDSRAHGLWLRALQELQLQMTRAAFDTWLSGSRGSVLSEHELIVRVRDAYAAEWLHARWQIPIDRSVSDIAGRPLRVRFEVLT